MEKELKNTTIELDSEGFLADMNEWNEEIASELAREEGIGDLNEGHWKVIHYMRDEYREKGEAPTIRRLTKESGVSTKELYQLFPKGPLKKAARIAGIPKPKGCI